MMMNELMSYLPHYSPLAPIIGLAVLAVVIVAFAVALARSSRRR
jgi:hypothetical protein